MSNRIFHSLALLLCLTITSVRSYGAYGGYRPRDHGLRQARRCPTCPADCPESLSSPWYGTPTVYGRSGPFKGTNNQEYDGISQYASYGTGQTLLRDTSNHYGNPFFGQNSYVNSRCPCSDGRVNVRLSRSENASPEESSVQTSPPESEQSFDLADSYDTMESRGAFPYGYPRSSRAPFISEEYRDLADFDVMPIENHRVSRHYGSGYKDAIRDPSIDEEALESGPPSWNSVSFPQLSVNQYESSKGTMYGDQLKAIQTPSLKKVYVVYRADADQMMDDDDLDRTPINSARQQHRQMMDGSAIEAANPMSDPQMEEYARRSMLTRQNTRDERLYDRQPRRGIYFNEQQRDQEESYSPHRAYDELYQRFNAEDAIDRQERRKFYRAGFGPTEFEYAPTMRFNPYEQPEDTDVQNIPVQGESLPEGVVEDNIQDNMEDNRPHNDAEISAPGDQELSSDAAQNADDSAKEQADEGEQPTTLQEALRDISREEEATKQEEQEQKSSPSNQASVATKRETDLESPAPINYRTHSRAADVIAPSFSGEQGNEEAEESGTKIIRILPITAKKDVENTPTDGNPKIIRILPITAKKDVENTPTDVNPDLIEDMEKPPTDVLEVGLQLNFETSDTTTPSPTN